MGEFVIVTPALSTYIAASQRAPLSGDIAARARLHILDTLASIVACRDLEPAVLARRFARAQSGDAQANAATMLGTRERAALMDAVFASAMTGHGGEINDFIPSAFVQPGPAVVSVALALGEQRGSSGAAMLRAVIAGYELAGRVPKALGIANLRRAGLANHGIGPVFGAAAVAASMLGLEEKDIAHVLSFCAQQASGSWQWLLDVEHIEKSFVFAGMGARAGLNAALLVSAGFRGVRDSLDHPDGWMRAAPFTAGDANRAYLIEALGVRSEFSHTAFKRYPVGGPTQPAVEAMLGLLDKVAADEIERIDIAMPGRWQAFRDAQMPALNLRYLAAIIMLDRKLDFIDAQSRARMLGDRAVRVFMERVDVRHDPAQEAAPGAPRTESARVVVTLRNGVRHEAYVPHVVGFPSHPMSAHDVEQKAEALMSPHLGASRANAVIEAVRGIETLDKAGDLVGLIAP